MNTNEGFAICRLPSSKEFNYFSGEASNNDDCFLVRSFLDRSEDELRFKEVEADDHPIFNKPEFHCHTYDEDSIRPGINKEIHLELLADCISSIKKGELEKVIAARIKFTERKDQNLRYLYESLASAYPEHFVYLFSHPKSGTWMGATPEKLLFSENNNFSTTALAGTRAQGTLENWGEKEIEEQAYVKDYILDKLNLVHPDKIEVSELKTKASGPVEHLQNDIAFKSNDSSISIAEKLHPTPAICGIPKDKSLDFIQKKEKFEREYYCGYIGMYSAKQCKLFVNLRCMQVLKNHFALYVGGGITGKSNAEDEWKETEMKASSLLGVIENL